jgi:hypothetical protein
LRPSIVKQQIELLSSLLISCNKPRFGPWGWGRGLLYTFVFVMRPRIIQNNNNNKSVPWFFAKSITPGQKMVTNSIVRKKLVQQLAQPKTCIQGALIFSLLSLGGAGGTIFHFFPCSMCCHYIPFNFPMGSHQIPIMFPKFPICSSTCFPQHLSLSHMFWIIFLQMTIDQNSPTM